MSYIDRAKKFREAASLVFATLSEKGDIPEETASDHVDMFDEWAKDINYSVDNIRRYRDNIYKCRQTHTSQEIYTPPTIPSIWKRIPKRGEGTHDNPIPYDAAIGMELEEGKFYIEDSVLYLCFRDTGVPVYNRLNELVGLYVEVSE